MTGATAVQAHLVAPAVVDLANARWLLGHLQKGEHRLLVDLPAVECITAEGLQHLRRSRQRAAATRERVLLWGARPHLALLLRLVGLEAVTAADAGDSEVAA